MLKDMKVAELRELADAYGVDREDAKTKVKLIAALEADGIDDAFVAAQSPEEDVPVETAAPVKKAPVGPEVLVKMNRANPTYEIKGHRFTSDHPFVVMSEDDAQEIFDYDPRGFVIATPKEAKEFYS